MIAVICLNPALDITHHVASVDWAGVNRPAEVRAMPGGKGLNVARTLHALGTEVLVLGLLGGSTGEAVREALNASGVPAAFTTIDGETRRTFAVVDGSSGDVALFNEPGPAVTAEEYANFRATYGVLLERCDAVVLSGSLPADMPADTYAELTRMALEAGVPALLDTSGAALRHGAAARPTVIKPNVSELADVTGVSSTGPADHEAVMKAAQELRARGPASVVVTLGLDGLLAVTGEGSWLAVPQPAIGNPTGAGDAVLAGLARGLTLGWPWPERLRHAAALGAATVAAPAAGQFGHADYLESLEGVTVTSVEQA